jgi:Pyruvate/2-oxoacid:ferredoxin oxidoreductase gamma subunit
MMFQVRFHGRGGQGVVTAAELLAPGAMTFNPAIADLRPCR